MTMTRSDVQNSILAALAAKKVSVAVVDGDPTEFVRALVTNHIGLTAFVCHLTQDTYEPSPLWRRLATLHPNGARLTTHTRRFCSHFESVGCPILPDRLGSADILQTWLAEESVSPVVWVFRDVDAASHDCIFVLARILRSLAAVPANFVLSHGRSECVNEPWQRLLAELRALGVPCLAGESEPPMGHKRAASLINQGALMTAGIQCCRDGALEEGVRLLTLLLEEGQDLHEVRKLDTLLYISRALLQLRLPEAALSAARTALALAEEPPTRQLVRRIVIAALHQLGRADELALYRSGISADIRDSRPSFLRSWLLLDAAMVASLRRDSRDEERHLDELLQSPPSTISSQCLSAAHLWKAAKCFLANEFEEAARQQQRGLELLESFGDSTRSLFAGLRLAGTLSILGRWREAADLFERHGLTAANAGLGGNALRAFCEAVSAQIEGGNNAAARRIVATCLPRCSPATTDVAALRLTELYCEAALALATRDVSSAGEKGLQCVRQALHGHEDWAVTLLVKGALLLAQVSRTQGFEDLFHRWIALASSGIGRASPADGLILLSARRRVESGHVGGRGD